MANDIKATISLEGKDALRTIAAIEKGIKDFGKTGTKSVGSLTSAMSVLKGTVGAQVVLRALDATAAAFKAGAKNAIEFGNAVAEVNSIAPRTARETLALKQQLIGLSNEFGGKAQKQAKAFYNIVSAGVQGTAKQLNTLEVANTAAVAGLVDIDTSARVLVASVNSYAASGLTAGQASDVLFNTVKEGITTFGELSSSIGTVAPLASAAGVKFSELGGTLAFLTKSGISTAEATTGLRAVLTGVIKPSVEAAAHAKTLGLEFSTSAIKSKGFGNFLKDVIEKTGGTETALAKLFPNVRALGPIVQLAAGDFEDFQRILGETANSTGATEEAFKTITKSAGFQFEKLQNQLANFPTAILTNFEEPIADSLKVINEFVGDHGLLLIADAVDVVISAFDSMQSGTAKVKAALAAIAAGAAELGIQWTELALAVNEALQSTQEFLGFDASESLKKEEENLKSRIATLKEFQQAQEEGAIAEILAAKETSTKVEAFRKKIEDGRQEFIKTEKQRKEQEVQQDKELVEKKIRTAVEGEKARFNAIQELKNAQKELELERAEEEKLAKILANDSEFLYLQENLGREAALKELNRIKDIDNEKKRTVELKKLRDRARKEEQGSILAFRKFEDLSNKEKIAAQKSTLSAIAGLSQSSNSTLFAIGKAASLSLAGINVAEGVTKALSAFPPPYNFAAATAVGAAGAIQLAKIASSKPPSAGSFQAGGIVEGRSQIGDQLTANVNGGEAIFNQRQQKNLFKAIDSGSIGGAGGNTFNFHNPTFLEDEGIDNVIDKINDAMEYRNKELRVS